MFPYLGEKGMPNTHMAMVNLGLCDRHPEPDEDGKLRFGDEELSASDIDDGDWNKLPDNWDDNRALINFVARDYIYNLEVLEKKKVFLACETKARYLLITGRGQTLKETMSTAVSIQLNSNPYFLDPCTSASTEKR